MDVMEGPRALKRTRVDEMSFWGDADEGTQGVYLQLKLTSGKSVKERGWPWVQTCVRGILGRQEKVAKANFMADGSLLVKTKNEVQTDKLLKAQLFGGEECVVQRDARLNQSKGIIHAPDLIDLSELEICGWFEEFGVVGVKRFTRKVGEEVQRTPTLLLTFNTPTCPSQLQFDYVRYPVKKYIPNPLLCHNCGKYGHAQERCKAESICLNCASKKHEGTCSPKCINCGEAGHGCLSKTCSVWKTERDICEIKVDRDVSYVAVQQCRVASALA